MKKLLIAAAVATAFVGINVQAASTGTITFEGSLTESTCDVTINGDSDPTIKLPELAASAMPAQSDIAGDTRFDMNLTNCTLATGDTGLAAYFSGYTTNANGRLVNQSTATTASNVTLELMDRTNNVANPIIVGDASQIANTQYVGINADGTATLNYSVHYYAEDGAATAGAVNSSVVYALQYQ